MKDTRSGIDTEAPVVEIVEILAKHGITIGLIDQVFERSKNRAINRTIVTTERPINSPGYAPKRERVLLSSLGSNTFKKVEKDIRDLLQNYNLDARPEIAQDLFTLVLSRPQMMK